MLKPHAYRKVAAAIALLACGVLAPPARAQAGPDLAAFTQTGLIPFTASRSQPFEAPPKVALRLEGPLGTFQPHPVVTDTGSTGVVVSAADLPDYSPAKVAAYPAGWEFLSSSKRLWVGHWVPTAIAYLDPAGGEVARAEVPVLVVETAMKCPGYDVKAAPGTCAAPTETVNLPKGIAYMGVGFGREKYGQSQGTPDKNPLLNLVALAGKPIDPSAFRRGYVVTRDGVRIGLTAQAAAGFRFVKLNARPGGGPLDWDQAPMRVAAGDQPDQAGSLLIDTGIATMYLGVANPSALKTHTETNQNAKTPGKALDDGQTVTVTVPTTPATTFTFTVGQADPAAPTQVLVNSPMTKAFVNTGRHALRRFEVLFDADGGWFGLRGM
jgi:hypothetical protein